MKKIIALLIMFVLIATSVSAFTIKQEARDKDNLFEEKNIEKNNNLCNTIIIDGNPITEFPPKTAEQLAKMDSNPQPTMSPNDLPSQFSWKNFGGDWTTGARDQANCGSCWAFSALAAMESAINIASGNPSTNIDLSEQYILSCLGGAGSCSGGWMSTAIEYIESTSPGSTGNSINGVCIEDCMPYQAVDYIPCDDKCNDWDTFSEPPNPSDKLWQVLDYSVTSTNPYSESDWDMLKSWVYTYGPLSVDINANGFGSWGNSHHSPDDVYETDNGGYTNHGVLLVGWVDDDDIYNGGYWIIKNSWGSGWGYGGFGNIAYGCNGVADRDCVWVSTTPWPPDPDNPGIPDVEMRVFADYDWSPRYPHLGEEIEFTDTSEGNVATREWDFNGDGIIDSTRKRPTWTYNQEGEYEVTLTVTSQWGLDSNRTYTVGAKELWPPVAIIKPESYADNEQEIQFDGRFSYDVDEGGRIVSHHWDFGDGTTSELANPEHQFAQGDKIYDVTLTVTDNDGASTSKTIEVKIDQTVPPETTIHHGFGSDGTQWYSETQRISFTATDWTSVIDTYYRIDGGEWIRYVPEENSQKFVPVSSEGMHTVEAYSVDYYGNEETPVSETFGIDTSDPNVDISLSGNLQDGQYIGSVTVSITADDQTSGLDKIMYKKVGDSEWIEYNGPFKLTEQCYLKCIAVDFAGNTNEELMDIPIEGAPSMLSITGPSRSSPGEIIEYTLRAVDFSPSYDDNIYYYVEWGDGDIEEWIGPYDSGEYVKINHVFNSENSYTIRVKAKDSAGAESDWETLSVTVPKAKYTYNLLRVFLENHPMITRILELFLR